MIIEKVKIKDVHPADWNPREISDKDLKKLDDSIKAFGYVEPIIVNKQTGNIVGGHQRFKILQKTMQPNDEIEAVIVDFDVNKEKALNLALNRISGDWNEEKLYEVLKILKEQDASSLMLTGFDNREIFKFLEADNQSKEDDFNLADSLNKNLYQIQLGDVYQMGNHKIMCADGTELGNWKNLLNGTFADMCFTDPPYNVDLKHRGKRPEEIQEWEDDFSDNEYAVFLDRMCRVINDCLKLGGVFYICQGWRNFHLNILSILKIDELIYHQALIWHKMWAVMGRTDYLKDYEMLIYGWKKGEKHLFNPGQSGDTDVWDIKKDNPLHYVHLTQKPVELPFRAINNNSKEGNLIIDLFAGSGSTLIACEQLKRICYSMEINPHYVSTVIERWENFTGKKAVKVS